MPLLYFEVYCADCGQGLCKLTTVNEKNGVSLEIKPCPECMQKAKRDGYNEGSSQGCEIIQEHLNS